MGCEIEVMLSDDGRITSVKGNTCRRGEIYARKEIEAPRRIVTSTVKVTGSIEGAACVSCKTEFDIPKEKIFDVISIPLLSKTAEIIEILADLRRSDLHEL